MRPKLVIFDCDGVLVDSERIANPLVTEELARFGLHLTPEQLEHGFVGGTLQKVAERARGMGADVPVDWPEKTYEELYRRLSVGTPVVEGVEAVMDRLDEAGIPYAVGSNGEERKMEITLGQHPRLWERLQGRLYSGRTLGVLKPDPGLYLKIAEGQGVEAAFTSVIEDSLPGCSAARGAGMRCFGYSPDNDGALLASVGAIPFHAMADLPGLLEL